VAYLDEKEIQMKDRLRAFDEELEEIKRDIYLGRIKVNKKYRHKPGETFAEWCLRHFGKGERRC
jgi:hypothetical protein